MTVSLILIILMNLSFAIYNLILCFEDLRAMLIDLRTDFVTKAGSGNSSESEDNNA